MRAHPRATRSTGATVVAGTAALLVLALAALGGCGARAAAPELRTGASPEACAVDGHADDSPATTGFIVAHAGTPDDAEVDAELRWVADETGTVLAPGRTLATGALLLRAEQPLGGQRRADLLCALARLAAVRYAAPDAEAGISGTSGPVDSAR